MTRWTPEEDTRLRQLWAEGHTASAIAGMMRRDGRNTVIGRAHRLKLPARPERGNTPTPAKSISIADQRKKNVRGGTPRTVVKQSQAKASEDNGRITGGAGPVAGEASRRVAARTATATSERMDVTSPGGENPAPLMLALVELTATTCKFPIGDPLEDQFGFCGHPSSPTGVYCERHARIAYQPPADRRRAA